MNRWVTGAGSIGLGLLLLVLAVPRMGSAFARLPGDTGMQRLLHGEDLTQPGLERVRRSRENALAWLDHPTSLADLGLIVGRLGADAESTDEARELFAAARDRFKASLAMAPADSVVWFWLSVSDLQVDDPDRAIAALRLSLLCNPYFPNLAPGRAELAMRLWGRLDDDTRRHGLDEIKLALKTAPKVVLASMFDTGMLDEVRGALANDQAGLDLLNRALDKLGR